MKTQIISGIFKVLLAIFIFVNSFQGSGPQQGLSIWMGSVISFPILLWGILDFVKKPQTAIDETNEEDDISEEKTNDDK